MREGANLAHARQLGNLSRGRVYLTAEELKRLDQVVLDAIDEVAAKRTPDDHPDDARRIGFFWATAPLVERD